MGSLVNSIKKAIMWMMVSVLITICFMVSCTERTIQDVQESYLDSSQYSFGTPHYDTTDYGGSMSDVYVSVPVTTQHNINDFKATVDLYDCQSKHSSLSSCKQVGSDYEYFDGTIKPGQTYNYSAKFNFYDSAHTGVLVPKLTLSTPRG